MAETHRDDAARVDPERRVADLLGVLENARRLATLDDPESLPALVEPAARRLLDCEQALLYLHDPRSDELVCRAASAPIEARLPAGRGFLGEVFRGKAPVNSAVPLPATTDGMLAAGIRSVLACPVMAADEVAVGVLLVADARRDGFDAWDEVMARALAAQAGAAIERQRLGAADRARRTERDLDLGVARQIQQSWLPIAPPTLPGYDIAGWFRPADETGGDFFDFQDRRAGRLAVTVGDVSGHGFGPALIVAACRAFVRATLLQTDEPARLITQVNQLLCQNPVEDRFVTAFFGILDRDAHRLDYVSAGQGPILFFTRAGGTFEELEIQGLPLGLSPSLSFGPPKAVVFAPGDFLALITDGFFEWYNPKGECFGIERMKAQIDHDRDRPAAEMIQRLYATVLDFAQGSPQPDDLTAVVIKRLP